MNIRFQTGQMAKLHKISKQTLIYYDKIGLFSPAETDVDTGYRYYTLEQGADLDVILCLKSVGMSLKEIAAYMKQQTTQERIVSLEAQETAIEQKLSEMHRAKRRLESITETLKERLSIRPMEQGIRWVKERSAYREAVPAPYGVYELELTIKDVLCRAREQYDSDVPDLLIWVDALKHSKLFQAVGLEMTTEANEQIPAGEYAYVYHQGDYNTLLEARDALLEFVAAEGYVHKGPIVEKLLFDSLAVANEDEFLVEIQILVEKT